MRKFVLFKMLVTLLFFMLATCYVFAAMQSSNYKIDADTINSSGSFSNSTSYRLGDTLGEAAIGISSSVNYRSKAGFWYMIPEGPFLGLSCEASNVYMSDYTLGSSSNSNTYLFSTSEECLVTANSGAAWSVTVQSSNLTGVKNVLSNGNVNLSTDGTVNTSPTITSPTGNITETTLGDYSLNSLRTVITGNSSAIGGYNVRPSIKLVNLNNLYSEGISGTLTFTIQ